jgi:hypothetical protein
MSIFSILLIIFIVLKAVGFITWSWWVVFTPIYIQILIWVGLVILVAGLDIKDPLWRYRKYKG